MKTLIGTSGIGFIALVGFVVVTWASGCGGAAKQTNTNTTNNTQGAESQPSK